jgi:hypothetical protein
MATSSSTHFCERYTMAPAQPSSVIIGVHSVIWISHDLQLMMSTDATQLPTTTDVFTHPSICSVLILPGTCPRPGARARRQRAARRRSARQRRTAAAPRG